MTQPISFLVDPAQPGAPIALGNAARRVPRLTRSFGSVHGALLAVSRGRLTSRWFGARVLVLETVGRRTGQPRSTPLVYLPDGDDLVVVAANAGARRTPAWWLNLQHAGVGVVRVGRERRVVRACEASGARRERLWRRHAAATPVEHYQRQTPRPLAVVVLEPLTPEPAVACHRTLTVTPYNRLSFNLS